MIITVIGKPNCSYCTKAKIILDVKGLKYKYYTIDAEDAIKNGYDQMDLSEFKRLFPDVATVPVVIVDGNYIGGYRELDEMLRDLGEKQLLLE